jgi:hypothetical protein
MDQGHSPVTSQYHHDSAYNLQDLKNQIDALDGYSANINIPIWDWSSWFQPYMQCILQ